MTTAKMAAKLTAAGVRYRALNIDGACILSVDPRMDWDKPVDFYCVGGRVRCQYGKKALTITEGIATAKLSGVAA